MENFRVYTVMFQRPSRRADERIEVRATSCPQDRKLGSQVDQQHQDVASKR
jgi:hypothetical protein